MYACFTIVACLRREKSKGQTGELGGESQFSKNPEVIEDF